MKVIITLVTDPVNISEIVKYGELVSIEAEQETKERAKPRRHVPKQFGAPNTKTLILDALKEAKQPLSRKEIIRRLRAHGFSKGSVGPICNELRKEGKITNPRRGFWALADARDRAHAVKIG
jgi:hypothetical protein